MRRFSVLIALVLAVLIVSVASADFPRLRRHSCNIVSPCFTPTVCHEEVHHAVIPTVATVVTVPSPVFVFQSLNSFPGLPPSAYGQQQYQQPPFQPAAFNAPQVQQPGLQLSDAQLDRIATLLHQKISANAMTQNTLLQAPPMLADEPLTPNASPPAQMSQAIVNDIGAKCSSCHMTGTSAKGGLAIFDQSRNFSPTKNGQPYASPEKLWQRPLEGSMPPSATTDQNSRLNPETIAFLRSAISGQ